MGIYSTIFRTGVTYAMQVTSASGVFEPIRRVSSGRDNFDKFKLVSFDLFDTLITRPLYDPSDVFVLCGNELSRKGQISIDPRHWKDIRSSAETKLQVKSRGTTYTLTEIYLEIAKTIGENSFDALAAAELELSIEISLISRIGEMNELLEKARSGRLIAIISDTYFANYQIEEIARSAGITTQNLQILSSSSARTTKEYGALFAICRSLIKCNSGTHLHIGDNIWSDVYRSFATGCKAVHYTGGRPTSVERRIANHSNISNLARSSISGSMRAARLQFQSDDIRQKRYY